MLKNIILLVLSVDNSLCSSSFAPAFYFLFKIDLLLCFKISKLIFYIFSLIAPSSAYVSDILEEGETMYLNYAIS